MIKDDEAGLLVEEARYWDPIEERDDGIPRSYVTMKEQPCRQHEPDFE